LTTKSCSEPGAAAPTLPPETGPLGAVGYCGPVAGGGVSFGTAGSTLGLVQAASEVTATPTAASRIRVEAFM